MTLTEEVAAYLDTAGVGVYHPDGTPGGTIYLNVLPDAPDDALAVSRGSGPEADARLPIDPVQMQIRVRGGPVDGRTSEATAQAVYDALHGLTGVDLPAGTRLVSAVCGGAGPAYAGRDSTGRHQWTVTVRAEVWRPTANRP